MYYTQPEVYEFISKQTGDPIVERRTCLWTGNDFPIFASEQALVDSYAPVINGKKYPLSPPLLSPEARNIQRMLFRNDRAFYKDKSDHDGRSVISIYPPGSDVTVYEVNTWYQDFRDPLNFGKSYTNGDNVWTTMGSLIQEVPRMNVDGVGCENSDYCNYCGYDKNCYMDIAGENNEDCYYCLFTKYSKRCTDCTFVYYSEYCYEAISCYDCNKIIFSQYLEKCHGCYFSFDLKNCSHCLWCSNLRNQSYCIFNKQVTKEEFEATFKTVINGSYIAYQQGVKTYYEIQKDFVYPANFVINAEHSVGNNIKDTKNSFFAFNASELEDSHYLYDVMHAKNCLDLNYSLYHPESSYQLMSTLELKQSICNVATHHSHHVYYCQLCNHSSDLFGCVGLNNKQYCIFNKQYEKFEYYETLGHILNWLTKRGEWGSYFPTNFTFHPYNDTIAQEYFPIHTLIVGDQQTIINPQGVGIVTVYNPDAFVSPARLNLGGEMSIPITRRTKNEEINMPQGISLVSAHDLEDNINVISKDILSQAISCSVSQRPYRMVAAELDLYKKLQIPLPRKHFEVRHLERMKMRPGRELYLRTCDKTGKEMVSVYPSNVTFKVYSEEAYQEEVYG